MNAGLSASANTGYLLLALFCCVVPIISVWIGWWASRRYAQRGLTGFVPGRGREITK